MTSHLTHRVIADLEATGMVLRRGTTARRNGTGGHRPFAGSPDTQAVKISGQAAPRAGLRDHQAKAAGFGPVTVEFAADDHKACYPGSHRIIMRVTGDRATGRLLGIQLFGQEHAEIATRTDLAAIAIYGTVTVDGVSHLDLPYTPPLASSRDAVQMGRAGLAPGSPVALTRSGH